MAAFTCGYRFGPDATGEVREVLALEPRPKRGLHLPTMARYGCSSCIGATL